MTNTPDFADRIHELAKRVSTQRTSITTEEATKHAFVLPFIQILGYDVFNPSEVTPELVADVGLKKGEKVDYAILLNSKPIIIFECKVHNCDLKQAEYSQLFRYFHVTDVRFSVLTNGVQYWFFTDLDATNKMDQQPFLKLDLLNLRDGDVEELRKFSRNQFDVENIISTASELKYVRELKRALAEELASPSDEFARLLISRVYTGSVTAKVRTQFTPFISKAYQSHLGEIFSERLRSVISQTPDTTSSISEAAGLIDTQNENNASNDLSNREVETTNDERDAFLIVRAICAAEVDVSRVILRDVQSYCGILFDDNNRKPICRLYFNGKKLQIGLFTGEDRSETRHAIGSVTEIYQHAETLRATIRRYTATPGKV